MLRMIPNANIPSIPTRFEITLITAYRLINRKRSNSPTKIEYRSLNAENSRAAVVVSLHPSKRARKKAFQTTFSWRRVQQGFPLKVVLVSKFLNEKNTTPASLGAHTPPRDEERPFRGKKHESGDNCRKLGGRPASPGRIPRGRISRAYSNGPAKRISP